TRAISPLSLHDALPISAHRAERTAEHHLHRASLHRAPNPAIQHAAHNGARDRKKTNESRQVTENSRCDQESTRDEDDHAIQQLLSRKLARLQACVESPPDS